MTFSSLKDIATMPAVEVPFQVQPLYRRISEALYLRAMKADEKLQIMFSIVQQEDVIRRLIELVSLPLWLQRLHTKSAPSDLLDSRSTFIDRVLRPAALHSYF